MSMTKGTPASSQIIFLEKRVAEQEAEIERLRGLIQFIGEAGSGMLGELYPVLLKSDRGIYAGAAWFMDSSGDTFIEAVENEMRSRGKLKP